MAALGKFRLLISDHNYQGLGKYDFAGGWRCHEVESVSGVGQASQATGVERAGMGRDRRGGVCAAQQAFSASVPSGGFGSARFVKRSGTNVRADAAATPPWNAGSEAKRPALRPQLGAEWQPLATG